MKFTPIASSSAGCSYILTSGDLAPLILDAGVSFKAIQTALDFRVSSVAGVLVSHAHGDHCKAVYQLLNSAVDVYASEGFWRVTNHGQSHSANVLEVDTVTEIEGWKVKPFLAVHDSPDTFGFLIGDQSGNRALYLTDSAYSPHRFDSLTHIFVECNYSKEIIRRKVDSGEIDQERFRRTVANHMSLETLCDLLRANDLRRVREIHLLHLSDSNSDEALFKETIAKLTGKPVYVAPK